MSDSAKGHSPFPHAIPDVATARRCVDAVVEYLAGKDDSPRAAADLRESVRLLSQPGTWQPIIVSIAPGEAIAAQPAWLYERSCGVRLGSFGRFADGMAFGNVPGMNGCFVRDWGATHWAPANIPAAPSPTSDPKE